MGGAGADGQGMEAVNQEGEMNTGEIYEMSQVTEPHKTHNRPRVYHTKGRDFIDQTVMFDWRPGRLLVLGLIRPQMEVKDEEIVKIFKQLEPKERLGKLRSTLGTVKEDRDGASYATFRQNWPEFRNANGLLIQRAFITMHERRRLIMDARYTFAGIFPSKERIEATGLGPSTFWQEVSELKVYIDGFMASESVKTSE